MATTKEIRFHKEVISQILQSQNKELVTKQEGPLIQSPNLEMPTTKAFSCDIKIFSRFTTGILVMRQCGTPNMRKN